MASSRLYWNPATSANSLSPSTTTRPTGPISMTSTCFISLRALTRARTRGRVSSSQSSPVLGQKLAPRGAPRRGLLGNIGAVRAARGKRWRLIILLSLWNGMDGTEWVSRLVPVTSSGPVSTYPQGRPPHYLTTARRACLRPRCGARVHHGPHEGLVSLMCGDERFKLSVGRPVSPSRCCAQTETSMDYIFPSPFFRIMGPWSSTSS